VSPPAGAPIVVDAAAPRLTVDQVGLWRLAYAGADGDATAAGPAALAVNPVASEGDLARPAPQPAAVPDGDDGETAGPAPAEGRQPVGRPLLVAVLVLAVGEWLWAFVVRPWRRRRAAAARAERPPVTTGGSR
jgi:hypothetical protein